MNALALPRLLDEFRGLPAETEWLDFKEAKQSFDVDELGKYVSALANEANLHERDNAWLVFGVKDKREATSGLRPVVGSNYKAGASALNELKLQIAQGTSPSITFTQIFELPHADCSPGSRVLMFQVPPAPRGQPIAWKGHFYGRAGESLVALGSKFEAIRMQSAALDWTAHCVTTDWSCLSPDALTRGRALYGLKHPRRTDEVNAWSTERFLAELRLARSGSLTRAALLLFGQSGAVAALGDVSPRLTWQLLTDGDEPLDYQHFGLPFALAVDEMASKIRIHTVRILPPGQLAPLEVPNYDAWVIREALLNCIAHQDYALGGRVQIKESPSALLFSNAGAFIPGSVEQVLDAANAVHLYRNPCLADAMVELGLIDTIGSGIKRMYRTQRERHFPMPDFEIGLTPPSVAVRIHGREIDPAFTRALLSASSLSLADVIALDHVQKRRPVDSRILAELRRRKLVEGRSPALHIAASVADATNQRGQYTRHAGLQKPALKQLVLSLIDRFGKATREEIDQTLLEAMPAGLTARQKGNRVKNLLSEMSDKDKAIEANRRGVGAVWTRCPPLSKPAGTSPDSDNV
jgi:ATP-dependent DNA helicase RecG